tara:strand:+ start:265 stop:495 length:231 start_codon:yes stop_codon:yes gene_type:complete
MKVVLPIEDHDGWSKNMQTGAIDCTNTSEYDKYMKGYKASLKKEKDFETLQTEVSELKSDMSEIKSLLLTLVQKSN